MDNLDQLINHSSTDNQVMNEDFWTGIRQQFHLNDRYLDFRCYAASSLPSSNLNQFIKDYTHIQAFPSFRNHDIAQGDQEPLRVALAAELHCCTAEVAIMRSTTEALSNVLMGFPFQQGNEVIASVHE